MQKTLVLAEKPSVARNLSRVLGCNNRRDGYYEGGEYIVTWALGHLVTLAEPEDYDKKYKSWRLEDLPMLPDRQKLVVIRRSGKQFNCVKTQLRRDDVGQMVIATDAGREGELVARWIIEKAGFRGPVKRLWISSVTDKAIKDGFKALRDGKDYENLYASAVARAEADWLVGLNATRALTCKYNAQLSCGRVQTPTLAIIAEREREIQNFVPKPFYGIDALTDKLKFTWQEAGSGSYRTFDKKVRDLICEKVRDIDAEVIKVDRKTRREFAPLFYDLTELQRDANRLFGYSAKETLSVMQSLYERRKLLTYPRTDSKYITADIVDTLKDRLKACGVGPYSKIVSEALKSAVTTKMPFVNDSKVSDHHGIIPTEQTLYLDELNAREKTIYDLVIKRFIGAFYPPYEYEQITITAQIGDQYFVARGRVLKKQGWKAVFDDAPEDGADEKGLVEQILPDIQKGDILKISKLEKTEGKTSPPAPFNEGSLLAAMEKPAKYMDDQGKELVRALGEAGGLGTVATRADIIEKLFSNFLIEKRGKSIHITAKGKQLLELVPEELKSPALTAEWEQKLGGISEGSIKKEDFIKEMKGYTKALVRDIKNSDAEFRHDNISRTKCPKCGKYMLEVKSKKGRMLVCQDRSCGQRVNVSLFSNARCPQCYKRMELYGEGEGQIFVCRCGYREKLSAFKQRKDKENYKVSKGDVRRFLKEQKKKEEKPINTTLADALSKLKL